MAGIPDDGRVPPVTPERPELVCERTGPVAVLRLNRPAVRNALGADLVRGLGRTLFDLVEDPAVRAVVLTGTAPGFCAGSDLRELAAVPVGERVEHETATGRMARDLQHVDLPVVAAVEGFAIGGGFLLATACDLVVTAADARWQLPEVELGWVPPWGLHGLVDRVGLVTARRLVWGAEPMDGRQAHRLGVADEVTAPGETSARALALATRLAALPPAAVVSAKRSLAALGAESARLLDQQTTWAFGDDCCTVAARRSFSRYTRKDAS